MDYIQLLLFNKSGTKAEIGVTGRENSLNEYRKWNASRANKKLGLTVYLDCALNKQGTARATYSNFREPH